METVFDYNITDEERRFIGISEREREDYSRYTGKDSANRDLASLFHKRGDIKRMEMYAEKLPLLMKWDFYRIIYHP